MHDAYQDQLSFVTPIYVKTWANGVPNQLFISD